MLADFNDIQLDLLRVGLRAVVPCVDRGVHQDCEWSAHAQPPLVSELLGDAASTALNLSRNFVENLPLIMKLLARNGDNSPKLAQVCIIPLGSPRHTHVPSVHAYILGASADAGDAQFACGRSPAVHDGERSHGAGNLQYVIGLQADRSGLRQELELGGAPALVPHAAVSYWHPIYVYLSMWLVL